MAVKDKSEKKPAPPPFVAPATFVGQRVYWQHGLNNEGKAANVALVTECCGNGRVRLAVLSPDNVNFAVHDDPVPHKDDPAARRMTESDPDAGTWEECPSELSPGEVAQVRLLLAEFSLAKKPAVA